MKTSLAICLQFIKFLFGESGIAGLTHHLFHNPWLAFQSNANPGEKMAAIDLENPSDNAADAAELDSHLKDMEMKENPNQDLGDLIIGPLLIWI